MECYEGVTMIKTFRGLIVDGGQETIPLHTNDGSTGYQVKKFQLFPVEGGVQKGEQLVKIYSVLQTTVTGDVDFSDPTLLAAAYQAINDGAYYGSDNFVVFENMIFNQDIYITHKDNATGVAVNYYIELEQRKIDLSESTVATLKDIRNLEQPAPG